ncbi:hypothetical protein FE782_03660 [Paenibacillus antri]|uniref:Uncharacterized protein n=1 Tax=Paenibacillus antri TaxID=2582848 RepID=A0A5R9GIZ0_9BACL|nr:hypothetical protein [Paenibacillus antri]TLS53378.1 hypothetical protein FE782_03660 [Paenibacillus antri]
MSNELGEVKEAPSTEHFEYHHPEANSKGGGRVLSIIAIILAGLSFIGAVLSVSSTLSSLDSLKQENFALRNDVNVLKDYNSKLLEYVGLLNLSHTMEGGIVTDDFVLEKVLFLEDANGDFRISMDISNQPTMALSYSGQGSYTTTDRELKGKILGIIESAGNYYTNNKLDGSPKWEEATVHVTVQNYELGTYSAGEFKLKGE